MWGTEDKLRPVTVRAHPHVSVGRKANAVERISDGSNGFSTHRAGCSRVAHPHAFAPGGVNGREIGATKTEALTSIVGIPFGNFCEEGEERSGAAHPRSRGKSRLGGFHPRLGRRTGLDDGCRVIKLSTGDRP